LRKSVPQRDLVRNPGVSERFELVLELFPLESAVRFKPSGVRICGCSPERDEPCILVSPLIYRTLWRKIYIDYFIVFDIVR